MYPHLAAGTDAKAVEVPLTADHVHDLDAMAAAVNDNTRMLLICNPNNPTSTHIPAERIGSFIEDVPPHVLVVLDEAYVEFVLAEDPDTSLDLVRRHPNLVILRTFSKAFGLAGLRVGYALGTEEFRAAVDRVRQPFSVNKLAQAAATEALRHQDDVARRAEWNAAERMWMDEKLEELGLEVADSQANFAWLGLGDADEARGDADPRRGWSRGARRGRARRPGLPARHLRNAGRERAFCVGATRGACALASCRLPTANFSSSVYLRVPTC